MMNLILGMWMAHIVLMVTFVLVEAKGHLGSSAIELL